jgi:putative heme-binding domain-containing protein
LQYAYTLAPEEILNNGVGRWLDPDQTHPYVQERFIKVLQDINHPAISRKLLIDLPTLAGRVQTQVAIAAIRQLDDGKELIALIENGKVSPRLLQNKTIAERFNKFQNPELRKKVAELTTDLAPADAEKEKLIQDRKKKFAATQTSIPNGSKVFTQNCAICHQVGGQGALIGPQLDGIGARGAERILEDILDPNRNVDGAFRYSSVTTKDDQVVNGLFRREEGEVLVFADATGKEIKVQKSDLASRQQTANSLMPDGLHEVMSEQDFYDLLAYLVSVK